MTAGEVLLRGENLLAMEPEVRARAGVFLSFQYPVEIPGVSMTNFMRTALNEKRAYEGKEPISAKEFLGLMREKKKLLELPDKLNNRSVNEGFSGGEKKKNEIFQMAMLEPCLSILDETDSGLDIDAARKISLAGVETDVVYRLATLNASHLYVRYVVHLVVLNNVDIGVVVGDDCRFCFGVVCCYLYSGIRKPVYFREPFA